MKIAFVFCFCMSVLTGFGQQTSTLSKSAYSVKYPSDWRVDASTDAKQFTISAPSDSGLVDNFVENMNMVINQLNSPYTAKEYAAFSKKYLPQKIKQFTVLEDKKGTTPAGKDSWFMVFKGIQFGKKLQWKQYYTVQNSKVYILTFTGEASKYKAYSKAVDAMIASFVIK